MITLAYDTETDGLVLDREKPDHPGQPHLVELGLVLYDDGIERAAVNLVVHPEDRVIPKQASDVHGITTETARRVGVPLVVACAVFSNLVKLADRIVAHNLQFDIKVMQAQFRRLGRPFPALNPLCTKELAEPVMRLPPTEKMIRAGYGDKFKAPNLTECYRFFFDEELVGAHGALVDAKACARVLFEIERRKTAEKETVG